MKLLATAPTVKLSVALAVASTPMTVPAPGLLSTMTGEPKDLDISGVNVRTTESKVLAPPGKGTIIRTV